MKSPIRSVFFAQIIDSIYKNKGLREYLAGLCFYKWSLVKDSYRQVAVLIRKYQ